jgi:hypothetical protein
MLLDILSASEVGTFHILFALDFPFTLPSAYTLSTPIHPCAAVCSGGTCSVFHLSFVIHHL